MGERRLYIDEGPGEARGVITVQGRAERLLIERTGAAYPRLGARYRARVARIERGAGLAILDLGQDGSAMLRLKADRAPPTEGQGLEVEISIEPQGDKLAVARPVQSLQGPPGLLGEAPSFAERLAAFAPDAEVVRGRAAREAADEAEAAALAVEHGLPGGGSLAIEITRALTAVDIDLGAGGAGDAKRAARQANLNAIAALARLLRLKALGGLVVIDLVGRGHDGPALTRAVQSAFVADQPGVIVGPITKFGTLELALPRRYRPLRDILCGDGPAPSAQTLALRLMRAIERQGAADPGGRLIARCAPEVAAAAADYGPILAGTMGARFEIIADQAFGRDRFEVGSL